MAQTLRKRPKKWLKIYLLLPLVSHMAKPMSKSAWHHPSPVAEVHWKNFGRNLMTGSALTAQLFLNSAQLIRVASSFVCLHSKAVQNSFHTPHTHARKITDDEDISSPKPVNWSYFQHVLPFGVHDPLGLLPPLSGVVDPLDEGVDAAVQDGGQVTALVKTTFSCKDNLQQ